MPWKSKLNPLRRSVLPPVPGQRGISGEYRAGFFSSLYFQWMVPLLSVGYQRPLELKDIWEVNPNRSLDKLTIDFKESLVERKTKPSRLDPLLLAIYDTFKKDFLIGGVAQLIAGCVQVISPFVLRYLISYVQEAYNARYHGGVSPGLGRGFGLVVGITCMQLLQSLCANQYYYRGMILGGQARSTIIACILEKAMKISGRAKVDGGDGNPGGWSNAKISNLMSTDTSRIDSACVSIHRLWVSPIQVVLALALLCINLTYSALVGFGLFCTVMPLLAVAIRSLMSRRKAINKLTDQRIHLSQEIFSAIRIVKFFAWEPKLLSRLRTIRNLEIRKLSFLLSIRNAVLAVAVGMPILASMLTFITYSLTGHILTAAPIFSSLALFNALGVPLEVLPMAVGRAIDAMASIKRISQFLDAEELQESAVLDPTLEDAITISNASFTWEQGSLNAEPGVVGNASDQEQNERALTATSTSSEVLGGPFRLKDINLSIGRKEFVAVIGSVGSGKSSFLSALAGDMRKTNGAVIFGASRALCSQYPWIQNTSLKQNVTFGKRFDESWYEAVIQACALKQDIDMLPNGDATEIGEKGVTISGGQKQRLSIARAIYFDADIVLMDDPLSAVDAHVGKHIVDLAICGLLRDKCRVLATHQLHVLSRADKIIWLKEGSIHKVATFQELMNDDAEFQHLMKATNIRQEKHKVDEETEITSAPERADGDPTSAKEDKPVTNLMQVEERATGSVSWTIYAAFIRASGSMWNVVLAISMLGTAQAMNILTNLWLSWWTSKTFNFQTAQYIGVYAALGVIQAIMMFTYATTLTTLCARAGRTMLTRAVAHTIRAPISFFDTTPIGRITNRFSKDVDTMDNSLTDDLRFLLYIIATLVSVFCLVTAYYYYFLAALVPLGLAFVATASYYRASAREIKRHEAVLRSTVFARFGEAITGTTTIRAYGVQSHFLASISASLDSMDGAYFLTFAGQRWLSTRLDTVGALLIFVVGILIVTSRFSVNPSIGGVVLAYMLGIVQLIQETVHVFTDVENEMISTERLYQYGHSLEQEESTPASGGDIVGSTWPEKGELRFMNVQMRYRPGLPLVLTGLTVHIRPGERVGIVGRTGAGKSSIISAIFRLVELCHGCISIDDVDISTVPLHDLRSRLSIIPQDPTLFQGTIRSNLDPFDEYEDLRLWEALRQAGFATEASLQPAIEAGGGGRIQLDMPVEDEGLNFSLGQRQLIALARVLAKGSQIIMFDEATSSVDFETDKKVQETIHHAFQGKTLLCIAHRLKTIIGYDRTLVMEGGQVAEYDSPLNLFDNGGIFRGMCDRSGITRDHIMSQREELRLTDTDYS
ncbi:ABC multidrug transporter [Myriangium duriaei CBS 260.36]|uniref:ABC multidrug transporter n=1 Tax=Myriangium duriaei CBS 260.36 TaxID=1168546 RepID=A0A9P4J8E6_9PEZI|nr:ABC multidrug transporter [Myriangium duriaei CBS 260.36]